MSDKKTFIEIDVNENYDSFQSFYTNNKDMIYTNIVSVYEQLTKDRGQELSMVIKSNIDGYTWSSELIFKETDIKILVEAILPHFESLENYEMCAHIMKIYKKLQ